MTKRQNQINAIGKFLVSQPNYEASPADIRKAHPNLFVQDNSTYPDVSKALKDTHEVGWTEKTGRRKVRLTTKGVRYFAIDDTPVKTQEVNHTPVKTPEVKTVAKALVPVVEIDSDASVTKVLEALPPIQSAYVEMMASAVVARHHLYETRTAFHPAFMTIGETGTGKTVLARILCRMCGFEDAMHIQIIGQKTVGELRGRRVNTPMGWMYQVPEEMQVPFIAFDEYDKATIQKRDAVLHYFQGDTRVRVENAYYEDRSVPMLIANPPLSGDRYGVLRPEYRRRAFVLDTSFMKGKGAEVEAFIRTTNALTERPVIDLERLTPVVDRITDASATVLQQIPNLLTQDGQEEYPGTAFLETLVFGWCALNRTTDTVMGAYRVGKAYLLIADTVGHVQEGAVSAFDECSDVTDVQAWVSQLAGTMRNRSTEIEIRRDGAEEFAEELNWVALREQWATYFDDLADELDDPPSEWNSRKNRQIYRHASTMMRKIAQACRMADTKTRLSDVLKGSQKWRERASGYVEEWEVEEETNEDEEEVVTAEIVDDEEDEYDPSESIRKTLVTIEASKSIVQRMQSKGGGTHLARATTLRVKYGLYTYACEECRNKNRRINGTNWAEQAYNVDVAWSNGAHTNTQHLCYPCAVAKYREVEEERKNGRVSFANFYPRIDANLDQITRQCTLCIHPIQAVSVVRYFGHDPLFKDLNGINVCDRHKIAVHQLIQEYPCRYDNIA